MTRIGRQLAFAAQIPPGQLLRRFWLVGQRKIERRMRPGLAVPGLVRAAHPPRPLFPARSGLVESHGAGWRFTFIGRALEMPGAIDWRAPGATPADQLWRMNLHYMEYLESLPDAAVAALVEDWIAHVPAYAPGSTSDSWNAYALSLRVLVWMQQLAARSFDPAFAGRAEAALAAQLRYLERHLETDIGGNHLIKNIKALLWASAFFDGAAARRWRRKGLALLKRALAGQMLADGMHFELSPSYHCQVFADLLEIRWALGEDPLDGSLDHALAAAAQVAADLAHPDGQVAEFGDAGLHMAYAPAECLAAFERVFARSVEPRAIFAFEQAGYFGTRAGGDCLIVDAGDICPPTLPAHGHGDMLSFEWSLAGRRIVVDQGVYEYVAGPARQASRAAASHNTLAIEGMDQAAFFGAFRSSHRGRIVDRHFERHEDGFVLEAAHDGFRKSGGPLHRRRFAATANHVRIEDRLEAAAATGARVTLLLHPDVAVAKLPSGQLRLTCGKGAALVTASGELVVEKAIWWPDMGQEFPTSRLVLSLPPGTRESWIELAGSTSAE